MLCFCAVLLQRQIPRAGNAKGIIRPPGEIGKEKMEAVYCLRRSQTPAASRSPVTVHSQCHLVKQDMLENPCHKTALYWNDMGILPAVRSSITGYVVQWEVFGYGKQTDCISALKMVYC